MVDDENPQTPKERELSAKQAELEALETELIERELGRPRRALTRRGTGNLVSRGLVDIERSEQAKSAAFDRSPNTMAKASWSCTLGGTRLETRAFSSRHCSNVSSEAAR